MGRWIGWVVLFAGSEALGIAFGEWFYRLFIQAVPPSALSAVHQGTDHAAFLLYGVGAGVAIFLWTMLIASIAGMVAARRATSAAKAAATPAAPAAPPPGTGTAPRP